MTSVVIVVRCQVEVSARSQIFIRTKVLRLFLYGVSALACGDSFSGDVLKERENVKDLDVDRGA